MSAWPVASCELHSSALGVDYLHAFGVEGKFDFVWVEDGFFLDEVGWEFVVSDHELVITGKVIAHWFINLIINNQVNSLEVCLMDQTDFLAKLPDP